MHYSSEYLQKSVDNPTSIILLLSSIPVPVVSSGSMVELEPTERDPLIQSPPQSPPPPPLPLSRLPPRVNDDCAKKFVSVVWTLFYSFCFLSGQYINFEILRKLTASGPPAGSSSVSSCKKFFQSLHCFYLLVKFLCTLVMLVQL